MTRGWRLLNALVVAGSLLSLASASAQSPTAAGAPKPGPQSQPAAAAKAAELPLPSALQQESFSYRAEGRRDPFLVLVRRGPEGRSGDKRPDGVAGLSVAEIALKGVMLYRDGYVALVQGPDTKTFVVHPNDRLFDGTVKAITADSLIMVQDVNDPLSLVKQREVRTTLRVAQEVKEIK